MASRLLSSLSECWGALVRSRLFWLGAIVRLGLMPLFGSYYLRELFIPFIDSFVLSPLEDPWAKFPHHYFPYGSVLLAIMWLPKFLLYKLCGAVVLGPAGLSVFVTKIPILAFDCAMLMVLSGLAERQWRKVLVYYWLSPIIIFVNYIHGQLDIVSMVFCLVSLVCLLHRRVVLGAVLFALALLCKLHVAVAAPVIVAYLWTSDFLKTALVRITRWILVVVGLTFVGFVGVFNPLKYSNLGSVEAMRLFASVIELGSGQSLYIGLMLVLLVLGRLCLATTITSRGLIFGVGTVFGALLLTTNAMPGWYLWVVPFLSLLCSLYFQAPKILYWCFNVGQVGYAVAVFQWDWTVTPLVLGVWYTVVQTMLLGLVVALWWLVVRSEVIVERRLRPLFIGIAGDSGSGKDYLSGIFLRLFSPQNTTVIEGDDYHKWERNSSRWEGITALNPRANDLQRLETHAGALAKGLSVYHHSYDHKVGLFSRVREVRPASVVIVQGLHTFYTRRIREMLNLKVFLAPDESMRLERKIWRDVEERGQEVYSVLNGIERRKGDSKDHIVPQKRFAEWIIESVSDLSPSDPDRLSGGCFSDRVVHRVVSDERICRLVDLLAEQGVNAELIAEPVDLEWVRVSVRGEIPVETVRNVAHALCPDLRSRLRSLREPLWCSGQDGITQLIAVCLIRRDCGDQDRVLYQT